MSDKPVAYDAYQELADRYAAKIDTKPHNAYYDRPAVLSLMPEVRDQRVLDAGCGPGAYAEALVALGANVVACDMSPRMLELAETRLGQAIRDERLELLQVDLTQPLTMFEDGCFALVNAPLCLDYIEDWRTLFREFKRVLQPNGNLIFSCGHPAFDAEYFNTRDYFSVERVECTWTGFGKHILMPGFRRSMEEIIMPLVDSGLILERILEPLPTLQFKSADPEGYRRLTHRPAFLCVRGRKPSQ